MQHGVDLAVSPKCNSFKTMALTPEIVVETFQMQLHRPLKLYPSNILMSIS